MFFPELFPTSRRIGRRMVGKVKNKDARYYLEPSAGKGDLAEVIQNPCTYEEFCEDNPKYEEKRRSDLGYSHWSNRSESRRIVEVIESDPNLVAVLRSKGYEVVGYDWLAYDGVATADAIIMNPPFSNGAAHLLKAWDWIYKGEIVCLLNEETILNPCTEERRKLAKIIADNGGEVEYLGACFADSERATDVRVAMVYLRKTVEDDTLKMWASVSQEKDPGQAWEEQTMLAIQDNLGNLEHFYNQANTHFVEAIKHARLARLYMNQNELSDYSDGNRDSDFKTILGLALDDSNHARGEFLRRHRRLSWRQVFYKMEFSKWLDSKQSEQMMRDVARDMHVPFTAANIQATLQNVFEQRNKLFLKSVANVFDELTSHDASNTNVKSEGWTTNSGYKVNERLIFPRGVSYQGGFGGWNTYEHYTRAGVVYSDLDRILCKLDGQPFEKCYTIGRVIDLNRNATPVAGGVLLESEYFTIRLFKKGTVHLKCKRPDLLERFNELAAKGKMWIGQESKRAWRPKKRTEDRDCRRSGGHLFEDGVCTYCESPEVDEGAHIECELCREVFYVTGVQQCPAHPALEIGGMDAPLMIE